MLRSEQIKELAAQVGFDLCGITAPQHFSEDEERFREWLSRGHNSTLDYMERHMDKRFDVEKLQPGTKSVVVCAVSYKNTHSEGYPSGTNTKIASYATTTDYHITIKKMLLTLYERIKEQNPHIKARAFTDSAPLLEKRLAVEAGLGWIGRQSLLITPKFGSFILLGELLIDTECDSYDPPFEGSRCGRCYNCIESCPTGAISGDKMVNTSLCIACHTVERTPPNPIDLDGWIFGCDRCLSCCPYNHKAPMHTNPELSPIFNPKELSAEGWLSMSEEQFSAKFKKSPLYRKGLSAILSHIKK